MTDTPKTPTVFPSRTRRNQWFWISADGRHGWEPTWELAEISAAYQP